jgi:hypothetical protein
MAEIQHSQIRSKIIETVVPFLDASDLVSQGAAQKEATLVSRGIAVTALKIVADVDLNGGAAALVDGGGDNGIDLIFYQTATRTLYIIQSKWSSSHASSIEAGEVLKFLQGVQDLVSLKKERFNAKIQARWPTIEDALTRLTSVRVIVAYAGSGRIDADIQSKIDDFIRSQNDTSELFFFQAVTQRELFQHFVQEAAPPQIDLNIKLAHFGLVEMPLRAVYGQLSVVDVARWYGQFGNQLFAGNIRHFLGMKSDVNSGISKTLGDAPENFWYYNNGLTLLVQSMTKQAIGGADRSVGVFECRGVTIVNGAQTVGSIGRTVKDGDSNAVVHARIIVVEDPESVVGKEITRASNTQNRIDARNFVALDIEQERIRTELLIDGVEYEYREGEPLESQSEGFEFIEAITTLACAGDDISYVAMAKGYVGGLYADISAAPYKALFNAGTSSKRLWSIIKLGRRSEKAIRAVYDKDSPFERGVVVHGNRLLAHCVFRKLAVVYDLVESDQIDDDVLEGVAILVLETVCDTINKEYRDAYLAPLFKNVGKCTVIRAAVDAAS